MRRKAGRRRWISVSELEVSDASQEPQARRGGSPRRASSPSTTSRSYWTAFRKILVLDGYSVDTVETGQEALGLIQKDSTTTSCFTDLKMPEFDGLDVTKAVKHLRPDIDVIMITGYATVQSPQWRR